MLVISSHNIVSQCCLMKMRFVFLVTDTWRVKRCMIIIIIFWHWKWPAQGTTLCRLYRHTFIFALQRRTFNDYKNIITV